MEKVTMTRSKLQLVVLHKTGDIVDLAACPICWEHFRYNGAMVETAKDVISDRFAFHLRQRHSSEEIERAALRELTRSKVE